MARAIDLSIGGAHRCLGALKATTAITAGNAARERFNVEGCQSITARIVGSSITDDPTIQAIPQIGTVGEDSATTGDVTTGLTAAEDVDTNAQEEIHTHTLLGERYVDIVVTCDAGDAITLTSVDVYAKRR
ncbi:hypothetical protein LCGC14_2925930 [marine sediment metagenome]|uniref:Uncharacterized protein n=1 Tax=marine sediment metagenome TaxID=412755 RepID=A0A0F8Y958_9ZZZZ